MNDADNERAMRIARLNDHFRHWIICLLLANRPEAAERLGRVVITSGIEELGSHVVSILAEVGRFADFDAANDPFHEHDFGAFAYLQQRIFWKIDYYAPDLQCGSEDPSDRVCTVRVLTVMLAEEY